jgi:uncharacterized Zn-finger protein
VLAEFSAYAMFLFSPKTLDIELSTIKTAHMQKFYCSYPHCTVFSLWAKSLESHYASHLEDRPFVCEVPYCHATANKNYSMNVHKEIHTELKPYKCKYPNCNKTFKLRKYKNDHRKRLNHYAKGK